MVMEPRKPRHATHHFSRPDPTATLRPLGTVVSMKEHVKILAARVPWWGKIAAKMILARLPVDNRTWKRLGLFEYGHMEDPAYAFRTFTLHFDSAGMVRRNAAFVGLELGPGDSLLSAMVAHAHGASAYHLVDVGAFAQADMTRYRAMADCLAGYGLRVPKTDSLTSLEAMLAACRATYGTAGIASLRLIADESVDFVWSHAVLQDIRREEFVETMRQLRRILRRDGISSHWVDLGDSFGGALNNLRFRESVWESSLMATSGCYTNRIRYTEMLGLFKQAGFDAEVITAKRWGRLPTPRAKLSEPFRSLTEEELCLRCFHVMLTREGSA